MKILVISPYFAPFSGVGGLRMMSLVNYLLNFNNKIIVISLNECFFGENNKNNFDYDKVDLYRYGNIEDSHNEIEKSFNTLINLVCNNNKFDIVIATVGPFYTLKYVTNISKKYDIPLIVDYRDLWLYDTRPLETLKSKLIRLRLILKEKIVELNVMKQCSAFVTITPSSMKTMQKHYKCLQNKSYCIYNGFEEQINGEKNIKNMFSEYSTNIVFSGKLSYYSNLGTMIYFEAIKKLILKGYKINVYHIGNNDEEKSIEKLMTDIDFPRNNYDYLGRKSYHETLNILKNSDICGAVINYSVGLGTKIFDYIYVNKPIVAYAPPNSEFELLLNDFDNYFVQQNIEEIENGIKNIIDNKKNVLTCNETLIDSFSRKEQNKKYHDLIKKISQKNKL